MVNEYFGDRRGIESFLHLIFEVLPIVGYTATSSSESEGWSYNRRIPCVFDDIDRFLNCPCKTTTGHLKPNALHRLGELLTIFSHLNGAIVCANKLHTVFLKDARTVQIHRDIERSLSAHGGEECVRVLALNYFLNPICGDGLNVSLIR